MKKPFFDMSNVVVNADGGVELNDAELLVLEKEGKTIVSGGANDDCGPDLTNGFTCVVNDSGCDGLTNTALDCINTGDCSTSTNLFRCRNTESCGGDTNQSCANSYGAGCAATNQGNCANH